MRRYHEEKHIIARRMAEWLRIRGHVCKKPSHCRKTHNGCNKASCQLCHPDKFPKRIPTRKEQQAFYDFKDHESDNHAA